ncbi:MAG: hypothetical protein R2695_17040 [Acidimicrobiales bacterium]
MFSAANENTSPGISIVFDLGLLAEDGEAGFEIGTLDVGDQAPLEPVAEAILEGRHRAGGPIRREHDLLVVLVQLVERVEELLLRPSFPSMNWMSSMEQHVVVAVSTFELRLGVGSDRLGRTR